MTATRPARDHDAELARRSHSTWSAVTGATRRWFPFVGSIGAWTVHLVALASLVQLSCNDPAWVDAMHAITAGTLVVTAAAAWFAVRLVRRPEEEVRDRALGHIAVVVCVFNAVLIVAEEVLVLALRSQRCG